MKKLFSALLTSLMFMLGVLPVLAKNNVDSIVTEITVNHDGSAHFVSTWSGVFTEGTENYIPINTSDITVSDFSVSSNGKVFTPIEWDSSASMEESAYKCGINHTSDGVELCWGISSYGKNTYTLSYKIDGFIKRYTDADGTNFMFVNPGMNTFPTSAKVNIRPADGSLTSDNTRVWTFGYDGSVNFIDGSVIAETSSPLRGKQHMTIMLSFSHGLFEPSYTVDKSFESVKEKAFKGSDYDDNPFWEVLLFILAFGLVLVALVIAAIRALFRRMAIRRFYSSAPYFRDTPNGGDIALSYYLAKGFNIIRDESLIIGACLLKMINNGNIKTIDSETTGFMGRTKAHVYLMPVKEPQNEFLQELYKIIVSGSGSDGILQEKELSSYANKRPAVLRSFIDGADTRGNRSFTGLHGFSSARGNVFSIKNLSENGKKELGEIIGLKKYLEDFSLIAEREIKESIIWQDYMVYAALFGIADKVAAEMKKIYPEKINDIDLYTKNLTTVFYYRGLMYNSMRTSEQRYRASGFGGRASLGGGGGFSGGGHGGGSR